MKRTTILADEELLLEAKHLAEHQGRTLTSLVQEALRDYVRANHPPRTLSFAGAGRSGQPRLAHKDEAILAEGLSEIEGWSPRRAVRRMNQDAPARRKS